MTSRTTTADESRFSRRKSLLQAGRNHCYLMQFLFPAILFLAALLLPTGQAFSTSSSSSFGASAVRQSARVHRQHQSMHHRRRGSSSTNIILHSVSEDDVLEAVEQAEKLWEQALEARKTANALCDKAEEDAEAAAATSQLVDEVFQTNKLEAQPITMEQLAKADAAASANLDAGSVVNRALALAVEAERLETLAEEALTRSEERLEQHLADFPESPLGQ
jgi:hypothetical protein